LESTLLRLRHANLDLPAFPMPPSPDTIVGTVSILIAPGAPITVLAPSEPEAEYTLIVPFAKGLGVRQGDTVRLRLGFADAATITEVVSIERATVIHANATKGAHFAFAGGTDIDPPGLLSRFVSRRPPSVSRLPNGVVNQS
jgi:hypothetical protein